MQTGAKLPILQPLRDGLKPRRGGLFIANERPQLFLLFFGGAAFAMNMAAWNVSAGNFLPRPSFAAPRRRKTKRTEMIGALPYKQATPTGFVALADHI